MIKTKKTGQLIVISAPSGAGKGTIINELLKRNDNFYLSISTTSRPIRTNDIPGVTYNFVSKEEFEQKINEGYFLEYTNYVGNYYGTPRAFVEEELEKGNNVILEIEVQGALNIKAQYPNALLLFITTKDAKTLEQRLIGRGTEDMDTIKKRLNRAKEEAKDIGKYEYIIVNDDLEECVEQIHQIVLSENCRMSNQTDFVHKMQEDLASL